jgi:hypothetical protein
MITVIFFATATVYVLLQGQLVQGIEELTGVSLRCCAIEERPYTFPNSSRQGFGGWDGLAIDYLDALQKHLAFDCTAGRNTKPLTQKSQVSIVLSDK